MRADNQQATFSEIQKRESSETTCGIPYRQALAMLLAMLYTDGCVSPKGGSWRIYFSNKSYNLVSLFQQCMLQAFAEHNPQIHFGHTKDNLHRVIVNSKLIGDYLVGKFGTFRTLRFANGQLTNAVLPVKLLLATGQVFSFLRVAFSCDGGVSFYPASRNSKKGRTVWLIRTVFIACAHSKLRQDYLFLLNELGIAAREVAEDGKIKIENEAGIRSFASLVGFVPGVRVTLHSKYWNGYEKNEVLKYVIASYSAPEKFYRLPKFVR